MAPKSLEKSCYVYRDIWSSRNEKLPEDVCISSKSVIQIFIINTNKKFDIRLL